MSSISIIDTTVSRPEASFVSLFFAAMFSPVSTRRVVTIFFGLFPERRVIVSERNFDDRPSRTGMPLSIIRGALDIESRFVTFDVRGDKRFW